MDKKETRKFYKFIRDSIPENERIELSKNITDSIGKTDLYSGADKLLVFIPIGSEVNTLPLISGAFNEGKTVAIPVIDGKEMHFAVINSLDELVPGEYNIPTAPQSAEFIDNFEKSICIVPCLSCDKSLNRIGYGGGFYDRFLAAHTEIKTVCVCFDKCLSDSLPTEEFDIKMNLCITDKKSLGGVLDV